MSVLSIWLSIGLSLAKVINDAPRVMLQIVSSLTDDSRGIIYDCNMFIVEAKEEEEEHRYKQKKIKSTAYNTKIKIILISISLRLCTSRNLLLKTF
jgi:predicted kinase